MVARENGIRHYADVCHLYLMTIFLAWLPEKRMNLSAAKSGRHKSRGKSSGGVQLATDLLGNSELHNIAGRRPENTYVTYTIRLGLLVDIIFGDPHFTTLLPSASHSAAHDPGACCCRHCNTASASPLIAVACLNIPLLITL